MTTQGSKTVDLEVKDFDDAVKKVLDLLCGTADGKTEAFFFRGWRGAGLGASALLRAISKLLKSTTNDSNMRKHFSKIIHVDCCVWKNRRMMQRKIAEELNLHHLMSLFDTQDEEDFFTWKDDGYRAEIASIGKVINESLRDERFLMIFHYGGNENIDLVECGIPAFGEGKVLYTNYGSFQMQEREQRLMSISANFDIEIYFSSERTPALHEKINFKKQLSRLLHEEAAQVIGYTGMDEISPAAVVDCFLYSVFLTKQLRGNSSSCGWATHAFNYWICDGILHGDRAWEVANGLYGVIQWPNYFSANKRDVVHRLFDHYIQAYKGWKSIASNKQGEQEISAVPFNASSYFLTFEGDGQLLLRNDLFQQGNSLRVLKLYKCNFDFSSPPFKCCNNLRFIWLDHCTNTGKEQGGGPCFPNLLVLDIRYTDYVLLPQMIELMTNLRELNTKGVSWKTISHAWKKLENLHKLRVTESSDVITVDSCSSVDVMNLDLLDLSNNTRMESLPEMSSARSLKVLVLDGCSSLENIAPREVPKLLESFSFDGYGPVENWEHFIQLPKKELRPKSPSAPAEAKVTKISLEGCARLHSIFLRALPNLVELDLSGTAIKTLDLSAMDVPQLKKLFLLGCQRLHALVWDEKYPSLNVLHVDTQGKMRSVGCCGEQGHPYFEACISFVDGRFLGSFIRGLYYRTDDNSKVHLHISSIIHSRVDITKNTEEIGPSHEALVLTRPLFPYNDIALPKNVTCCPLVWDHQQLNILSQHVEIGKGSNNLESHEDNYYSQYFTRNYVQSLHVHDNSSIRVISNISSWDCLEWCHIEKCSKLHTLFTCYIEESPKLHTLSTCSRRGSTCFDSLRTVSASDLLMAYCIWRRGINQPRMFDRGNSFTSLQHIYLHNCPRLVFVLPISFTLPNVETLHIAYCQSLQYIFPFDDKCPTKIKSGVTFKNLKKIKLYHLHKLEQICEARLTTPALEMIILRDCWGLRQLPAVSRQSPKTMVDCEKDWWDKLEWDGSEGHDPSVFDTCHSTYYKKTIPRGSLLRCLRRACK